MQYGATCPKCNWFETDYNNSRQDVCGRCRDKEFRATHGGVDQVTDFLFPGAKHVMPAIKVETILARAAAGGLIVKRSDVVIVDGEPTIDGESAGEWLDDMLAA